MKNSPKGEIPWDFYFDFYLTDAFTNWSEKSAYHI